VGVARLSRVTVILPRGDYQEALTYLSQFEEFHRVPTEQGAFDPATGELAVRAVRLFAQTDQAVKSLSLPLSPPMLDVIFRGIKVPETVYEAARWNELLDKAESEARPIVDAVNGAVGRLAQLEKDDQDARALSEALRSVADLPVDLGKLGQLKRLSAVVAIAQKDSLDELRNSLSDLIFVAQPLRGSQSVVLVAGPAGDAGRIEKVLRTLEVTPIVLPSDLPQNPPEAFRSLVERAERLSAERRGAEEEVEKLRAAHSQVLLACRELANVAHQMLDEVRNSGKLERMAILSGYIPASREGEFLEMFARWIVYVDHDGHQDHSEPERPTLLVHSRPTRAFAKVTESQGLPGRHEVDPTPIISLFFPVFFGMMFGDLGHGLIVTAFGLLLRSRSDRNLRQWGTIFTAAGISASVFGTLFGEIFGFSIGQLVPIPPLLEIVTHTSSGASLNQAGITTILTIALLIGLVHISLGLSLSVYEAAKAHERMELILDKIPALVMYISGIGFGLAFIQAGYSFKGVVSSPLGVISIIVITPALLVTAFGRGVATITGKLHEDSVAMAFMQGLIELLIRIAEFVANTISYARLAILLLVHAALLLTVNMLYYSYSSYAYIIVFPLAIFNLMIILLEGLIVYIQDMRLHLYEWFTKFYSGDGVPFRRILPERERIRIKWL
jgi:V/A-type H+-transporting ATPase subunit I